jgi:hypothetical protein
MGKLSQPGVERLITIDVVAKFSYGWSNRKTIAEVALFPGMLTIVEGVIVSFPELSLPDQNRLPLALPVHNWSLRIAYCKVKALLASPPVEAFQETWTLRTVTDPWGLVIVIPMALSDLLIGPWVILSHPGIAVAVAVGVAVGVKVGVTTGVFVG